MGKVPGLKHYALSLLFLFSGIIPRERLCGKKWKNFAHFPPPRLVCCMRKVSALHPLCTHRSDGCSAISDLTRYIIYLKSALRFSNTRQHSIIYPFNFIFWTVALVYRDGQTHLAVRSDSDERTTSITLPKSSTIGFFFQKVPTIIFGGHRGNAAALT